MTQKGAFALGLSVESGSGGETTINVSESRNFYDSDRTGSKPIAWAAKVATWGSFEEFFSE